MHLPLVFSMSIPESDELNAAIPERKDLIVPDPATTEIASAASRRHREGGLSALSCARLQPQILADVVARYFTGSWLMQPSGWD